MRWGCGSGLAGIFFSARRRRRRPLPGVECLGWNAWGGMPGVEYLGGVPGVELTTQLLNYSTQTTQLLRLLNTQLLRLLNTDYSTTQLLN